MFCGRATVMPCCNIGVTTMKIIRRTNIMSTIGVTLISDVIPLELPPVIAIITSPSAGYRQKQTRTARCESRFRRSHQMLCLQLLGPVLDEIVDQLGSRVIHFNNEAIHLACEIIE